VRDSERGGREGERVRGRGRGRGREREIETRLWRNLLSVEERFTHPHHTHVRVEIRATRALYGQSSIAPKRGGEVIMKIKIKTKKRKLKMHV
jgi:hypothetical protein